jgi:hypothetical protein
MNYYLIKKNVKILNFRRIEEKFVEESLNYKYSMILLRINNFLKTIIQYLIYFIKYDIKIYVLIIN